MKAAILTIGDELLIGQVLNTNAHWMAQQLNEWGLQVVEIRSIPDQLDEIVAALAYFSEHCDLVLITGGLGPTKDDVTKTAICKFFDCELVRDEEVLKHVKGIFASRKIAMPKVNEMQADVPAVASVLMNDVGTAPGLWIKNESCAFAFLPGVPFEMKFLLTERVFPLVKTIYLASTGRVYHRHFLIAGIGESYLSDRIRDLEKSLPPNLHLAYLPSIGYIRMRISAHYSQLQDKKKIENQADLFVEKVRERMGTHFITASSMTLPEAILAKLISQGRKIATAESCTGGLISHLFTQVPGSSQAFEGGAVVYSNALKEQVLGVSRHTLEQWGAVSEQTVQEMARGALERFHVDIAVSVSGIAGPTGAVEGKPVGTVWIAVASHQNCVSTCFLFEKGRAATIESAAQAALFQVWKLITE